MVLVSIFHLGLEGLEGVVDVQGLDVQPELGDRLLGKALQREPRRPHFEAAHQLHRVLLSSCSGTLSGQILELCTPHPNFLSQFRPLVAEDVRVFDPRLCIFSLLLQYT